MIEKAINRILKLSESKITTIDERKYLQTNERLLPIEEPERACLEVNTLSSFCDLLGNNYDDEDIKLLSEVMLINIISPIRVSLMQLKCSLWGRRPSIFTANAITNPSRNFGRFLPQEDFIVWLQTAFLDSEDRRKVLQVAGGLRSEKVATLADDGVTQVATVKAGVQRVRQVEINNPVVLKPIRTFQEIDQPEQKYILRLRDGKEGELPMIALFEVEDNMWQLSAMKSIKEFIEKRFEGKCQFPIYI